MKVLQVHNRYRFRGGEDMVVETTTSLLKRNGVEVCHAILDSAGLDKNVFGKLKAFATGLYSRAGRRFLDEVLERERPDVVHVHNLFPLFSPMVLLSCRAREIPVVMTCHNYRLLCPTGIFLSGGKTCDSFCTGKEYKCVLNNCRGDIFESVAYALRSTLARRYQIFENNVTLFIALTWFAKNFFVSGGIPESKIVVLPNTVPSEPSILSAGGKGEYIAFVGRISREKGIDTLLTAARITGLPVHLAGDPASAQDLVGAAPANMSFRGFLDPPRLSEFYRNARFLVFPSIWNEMFPLSLLEAMRAGLPVICSRIGGLPEIIDEGVTGFLFEPGNSSELAARIRDLWDAPRLCLRMGQAAKEKFEREYNEDAHFNGLMAIYEKAIAMKRESITGCGFAR